jgi:hypothetical protein
VVVAEQMSDSLSTSTDAIVRSQFDDPSAMILRTISVESAVAFAIVSSA